MNKKKIISWLLVISWLVIIFLFSNQSGDASSGLSNGILKFLADFIKIPVNFDELGFIVRKVAHFTEYFILGLLVINLIKCYRSITKREIMYSILLCFLYAVSDEFHQMFVGGRSPQIIDVIIDTSGSIIGTLLFLLLERRKLNE